MYNITQDKKMLGYSSLKNYPNIFCFSTTRQGGVSTGNYGSFNCSPYSGDNTEAIRSNWSILDGCLPQEPIRRIVPYQTHEAKVFVIDEDFIQLSSKDQREHLNGVDALITSFENVLLTIFTADCVPIVFYDTKRQIVGLAHAGWRGTVAGIATNVLEVMKTKFQSNVVDIKVCIGPSISLEAFEVGAEVVEEFKKANFAIEAITQWNSESQKYHIDLWKANSLLIESFGVPKANIDVAGICTYTEQEQFYSARRLGIKSGRICTGIMILKNEI